MKTRTAEIEPRKESQLQKRLVLVLKRPLHIIGVNEVGRVNVFFHGSPYIYIFSRSLTVSIHLSIRYSDQI